MLYIILFQTILIIILLIFLFHTKVSFVKQQDQISMVKDTKNKADKTPDFWGLNQRNDFRVSLNKKDCLVKFLEFENENLDELKHKKFNGYLENVSISGLKLICSYVLPIKQSIMLEVNFSLKNQEFSLKGEVKRKEEHNHKNLVAYGVRFIDISDEEKRLLSTVLNQIIIEKRKK